MRGLFVALHFCQLKFDGRVDLFLVVFLFLGAGHVIEVDEDVARDRVHRHNPCYMCIYSIVRVEWNTLIDQTIRLSPRQLQYRTRCKHARSGLPAAWIHVCLGSIWYPQYVLY